MLLRGIFSLAAVVVAVSCNAAAASTILVDSSGSLTKSTIPTSQNLVALLSSPGTPNLFTNSNTVSIDENIISAPGANLEESGLLGSGIGAAAAASVAGSVILTGVTIADVEAGLDGTRHGRTLAELFSSVLRLGKRSKPTSLIIAVQTDKEASLDSSEVEGCVQEIFDSVAAAIGSLDELDDYFDITSTTVTSSEDVSKIMSSAQSAAKDAAKPQGIFGDIYKQIQKASDDADPTPVAEAILSCNDAYSRASRTSRAKIAAWKHRVSRNLMVNNFGSQAESLLTRTLDMFDRDTMAAAGLTRAGEQRLVIRNKLQSRLEGILESLFDDQMALLEKMTLKRFQLTLLRKMDKDTDVSEFFENNADALRSAAFAFDNTASSLEIPSLSLTKSKAIQDVNGKLNNALLTFPDSPAAKIKAMKKVEAAVSKKQQPKESGGSISAALDLVAMVRPDGFGNLQGFAGYQFGQHSVTVGVHNDADEPSVIAQFGGVRPPFLRVQPKLKLDVEL